MCPLEHSQVGSYHEVLTFKFNTDSQFCRKTLCHPLLCSLETLTMVFLDVGCTSWWLKSFFGAGTAARYLGSLLRVVCAPGWNMLGRDLCLVGC